MIAPTQGQFRAAEQKTLRTLPIFETLEMPDPTEAKETKEGKEGKGTSGAGAMGESKAVSSTSEVGLPQLRFHHQLRLRL